MNGATVYQKLKYNSNILDEYIVNCYEALHTQGKEWIEQDIIEYMTEKGLI
ncbi:MAG: DUF3791 domain-containing protein [Defluviitaleaceae bacterium]|nr:DUF3791 domain-containing protein [Defluviitaleaceae bacterium]